MEEIDKVKAENEELKRMLQESSSSSDLRYRIGRTEMVHSVYRFKLIYSLGGLVLGGLSMLIGAVLFLFGVVGSTSWTASLLGAESKLSDAAPGSILFIVGLFVVLITRFRMRIRTGTGSNYESH